MTTCAKLRGIGALVILGWTLSAAQVVPGDSLALVDFYIATNGPQWQTNYNWLSSAPVGTWYGVQVSGGRVVSLGFPFGNNLQGALPPSIGTLTGLQSLGLGGNSITSIPPEIGNLTGLQSLLLASNQISQLPPTIGNLHYVIRLDVSQNSLTELPQQIGSLANLEELSFEANQISLLPTSIGNLFKLRSLNAMNNRLGSLPQEIANLRRMKVLYLGGNELAQLSPGVCTLDSLELLWLFNNRLSSLPSEIGNLMRLRNLHFQGNVLQSLPPTIGNLVLLQNLHLGENQLRSLPQEIGNLTALRSLRVYYNQLDSLPATIGNLTGLTDLWLQQNNLVSLPQSIGNLVNVTHLWLDENELTGPFPDTLGNLSSLILLSLRNNRLAGAVPERIGHLTGLGWLFLGDNRFDALPSFAGAPLLRVFSVYNNRLTFEDIEPNIGLPFTWFGYVPQDSVGDERDTTVQGGSPFEVSVVVGGSANQYQWLKNGTTLVGADSAILYIPAVDSTHAGVCVCRVTSSIVPVLEIYSRPLHLFVEGSLSVDRQTDGFPSTFSLDQNYPNPFNPTTASSYQLSAVGHVTLKVYDLLGREVATLVDEAMGPGRYERMFNGENLASGIYFYRLEAGRKVQTKKLVILK